VNYYLFNRENFLENSIFGVLVASSRKLIF
jgi:hypothetical protein